MFLETFLYRNWDKYTCYMFLSWLYWISKVAIQKQQNSVIGTCKWHATCQHSWHVLSQIFPTALVVAFLKGATSNCNNGGSIDGGYDNNELWSSMVSQQGIYFLLLPPMAIKTASCQRVYYSLWGKVHWSKITKYLGDDWINFHSINCIRKHI